MMKHVNRCLVLILCLVPVLVSAQDITIVHFEFQPLDAAILKTLMEKTGIHGPMKVYPWARAYEMLLNEENILAGPLARKKDRESLMKYLDVTVYTVPVNLYKLSVRDDIVINNIDDLKQYQFGAVRGYSTSKYLLERGFEVDLAPSEDLNIKKLFGGRIDMIIMSQIALDEKLAALELDGTDVEKAYTLYEGIMEFAFSNKTSDDIVDRFRNALKEIKEDGTLDSLEEKYPR